MTSLTFQHCLPHYPLKLRSFLSSGAGPGMILDQLQLPPSQTYLCNLDKYHAPVIGLLMKKSRTRRT
ncbi:hypothetical protein K503DRAFT_771955 [Rhizopogon vinicolor AM-OR11-026]|uniref:Uncharacterized protein n=1 Tax=Rhizopogon vinicolor AM-OR11-026 TaxID=1314800 RepID=A0A1B7MJD9_9AGAM|nr:hypothetical protein K503DRAFT_776388 [Rhizopogon vinicolor AM-OR11-026]OAX36962.1 hypothetical protein K503DRAFT_771955 [Rhizopogon vinicolor AM-OR11-026]